MKKLYLVPLLLICSSAYSATGITLYGIIEEGVLLTKGKHNSPTLQVKDAYDIGSRWGIKGVEEIGNGLKAGFDLEAGFHPDDGSISTGNSNAFGRESVLWLQSPRLGRLAIGRAATLGSGLGNYNMQTGYAFVNGYGLMSWDNCMNNFQRVSNALIYMSPDIAGWTLGLMYSNGINSDTQKWSHNRHYWGLGLKYKQNSIQSSLIFEAENKANYEVKNGIGIPTIPSSPRYTINYGFEYSTQNWTPMFAYRFVTQEGGVKAQKLGLSALIPYVGGRFKVGAAYMFGKDESITTRNRSINHWQIGLGYEYPLSKRTTIKCAAAYAGSGKGWKENGFTSDGYAYNAWQTYIGMHHFF